MSTKDNKTDLATLWEQHCAREFHDKDVDGTMETMVANPYVNHVPTLTGGSGYEAVKQFYTHHFTNQLPADTKMIPISRTVGESMLVDEMIFCFTHDTQVDFMLPCVKPTGKYVEVPLVAIVSFEGDKISHEHIYWDQASLLVQIGLLDPRGLPVAGIETARKVLDRSMVSNSLISGSG